MSHISYLSKYLIRAGHEVKIIAPQSDPEDESKDDFIRLGGSFPVPTGGSIARISLSIWLMPRIRRLLEEEKFDVIHFHEPLAPFLPLVILRLSNSLNVGTFHAFHGSGRMYWFTKYFMKRWTDKLHGRIAVSKPALSFVGRHFPAEYRIIPNGIDFDRFSYEGDPIKEFRDGKVNILFVGRLEKRKGLRYLLGAYGRLKWEYPNTRLIVVGPGEPDGESIRLIAERHIEDVAFIGGVSYDDLPRYYHSSDIFCSPATGKESFGIVLLEAMAAGKPIVASDIEGYASVMTDGDQGFLVKHSDEEALQKGLESLLSDSELRIKLGSNGRERAKKFDWPEVTREIIDYYELLLETNSLDSRS